MRPLRRCLTSVLSAAALAVALAGCSDTTAGTGTPAADGSATGGSTESSAPPTEDGGDDGGDEGTLDCEGDDVVAPEGQPFCFDLPDGFAQQEVTIDNSAGAGASYSTSAALGTDDLVLFSVYPLNVDSDTLSDQEIADALAPIIDQLSSQGFTFETTTPEIREVDDARAYFYRGGDGTVSSETYFIFRGTTELQVNCQYAEQRDAVLAGCTEILDSLEITG